MATSVWKGHLTFGLVSIPVKLYPAARPEKVGFRQVHEATGTRVRQTLWRDSEDDAAAVVPAASGPEPKSAQVPQKGTRGLLLFPSSIRR